MGFGRMINNAVTGNKKERKCFLEHLSPFLQDRVEGVICPGTVLYESVLSSLCSFHHLFPLLEFTAHVEEKYIQKWWDRQQTLLSLSLPTVEGYDSRLIVLFSRSKNTVKWNYTNENKMYKCILFCKAKS